VTVGMTGLEIRRAYRSRRMQTRRHVPRTVRRLRLKQVTSAAPPGRNRRGNIRLKRPKRFSSGIGVTGTAVERGPTAIGLLSGLQLSCPLVQQRRILSRQGHSKNLIGALFRVARLMRNKPRSRLLDTS